MTSVENNIKLYRTKLDTGAREVLLHLRGSFDLMGDKVSCSTSGNRVDTIVTVKNQDNNYSATYRFKSPTIEDVKNGSAPRAMLHVVPQSIVNRFLKVYAEAEETVWK